MAYTSYKNKIYAGNAKRTGENPLIVEGVVAGQTIAPGSAVNVTGGTALLSTGNNVDYDGQVADRVLATEGGDITTVIQPGEHIRVIQPLSGDYVNLLFEAGQNIESGRVASASDTVSGKHIIASSGGGVRKLFKTDETLGILAEDTLVRCIKL
jgi:hypothetical protein